MRKRRLWRKFWPLVALLASAGFLLASAITVWAITLPVPDFDQFFQERIVSQSTKIYDRTGTVLLYDVHSDVRRTVIPFDQIAEMSKKASVAIEDSDFYNHGGVRPLSIIRAALIDLISGQVRQGGSTITQQVVKMTILNNDKTISRKIKEIILAFKLESKMTKDQILSLYLNEAPYGGSIYGIEAAAKSFFGKSAKDLDLAEAAYLAAIPQAPTYYSPYGNNKDQLDKRKNLVLDRMAELGTISKTEANAAKKETVAFLPASNHGIKAPHFVFYIKSYLESKYGEQAVENGGLTVITSLDWAMQQKAEELVKQYATSNETKYNAHNMGLVAIDPKTGQILAMVGSKDYFDIAAEGNFNITLAHRQPGSSFKPFVYAAALAKGFTPETMVFDVPTQFSTNCPPNCYQPENYDGKYVGPISFKDALAQSRNVPAVKVLYLAGINNSLKLARDFGIASLGNANQYGLTLVLGGGEVSLLEMTGAYGVFANDGVKNTPTGILEVKDSQNNDLEKFENRGQTVIDPNIVRQITSILDDPTTRRPLFGNLFDGLDRPVAVKTGTTNDYKDAWILGYTPNLVVGAWAGNNDNSPMAKKVSGLIIAPMWNDFIKQELVSLPIENFIPPAPTPDNLKPVLRGFWQGDKSYFVDKISGNLATQFTPTETKEERVILNPHSILYWVNKDNPQGPEPSNPSNDPQFKLWEQPVQKWLSDHGIIANPNQIIPQQSDNLHQSSDAPNFNITVNNNSGVVTAGINGISSLYPITQVDYFLNDNFLGSVMKPPYQFSFSLNGDTNILRVVVYDSVKNKTEKTQTISSQ